MSLSGISELLNAEYKPDTPNPSNFSVPQLVCSVFPWHAPPEFAEVTFLPGCLDSCLPGLSLDQLPLSSCVCMIHAALAMLPLDVLAAELSWGRTMLLHILAQDLLDTIDR